MEFIKLFIAFLGGIGGGLYGSAVGGGGLFTLPLLLLFGMPIHVALGTQRFAAVLLELSSSVKFHTAKKINYKIALPLGIIAGAGAFLGVNIVIAINERYLNAVIALLLVVIFFILINKDKLAVKEHILTHKHYFLLGIFTFLLGIYGGFFSAGFGSFIAMLLIIFGFRFIQSAAISRVIGVCMSTIGMIVFASHGLIDYRYGFCLGGGFAIGSWIGIGIALRKGENYVKILLLIIIIITAIQLILKFLKINIF